VARLAARAAAETEALLASASFPRGATRSRP
jgi:hypothetical protein